MIKKAFLYGLVKSLSVSSLMLFLYGCSHKSYPAMSGSMMQANDWYAFVKDQKYENPRDVFNVSDSMVRLYGDKPGYLMSKKSYSGFELMLEYRWNTDPEYRYGGRKNSGVMYNVPENIPDMLWPKGIQFQIKEDATGDFILLNGVTLLVRGKTLPPGKSTAVPRLTGNENAIGEWNRIIIKSDNGKCDQYLNGKLVNEGTEASSKDGRILLQYEGSPIDFRKIIIKPL